MKIYYIPIVFFAAFIVFAVIQMLSKNKKPFKRAFVSVLSGVSALTLVNVLSVFTGVYIPVSILSVLISTVLGIPGVTSMLVLNTFL